MKTKKTTKKKKKTKKTKNKASTQNNFRNKQKNEIQINDILPNPSSPPPHSITPSFYHLPLQTSSFCPLPLIPLATTRDIHYCYLFPFSSFKFLPFLLPTLFLPLETASSLSPSAIDSLNHDETYPLLLSFFHIPLQMSSFLALFPSSSPSNNFLSVPFCH